MPFLRHGFPPPFQLSRGETHYHTRMINHKLNRVILPDLGLVTIDPFKDGQVSERLQGIYIRLIKYYRLQRLKILKRLNIGDRCV